MPTPQIKSFAKKTGKSEAEIEKKWDKSKELVRKQFPDISKDSDKFFKIVTGILKKMLNIKEEKLLLFKQWLELSEIDTKYKKPKEKKV